MPEIAKALTPAAPAATPTPAPAATPGAIASAHADGGTTAPKPTLEDVSGQIPAHQEPANDNAQEPPPVEPEDDFDPWTEKVRGELTAKQLIDLLKASEGLLPQELLDLEHEFVFGQGEHEERQRMSLKDALDQSHKERMQLRDYSRRRHELHQAQLDLSAKAASLHEAVNALNNPQTLFDDLIGLGVTEENLYAAAQAFAIQQVQLQKMPPEMRQMIAEQRKLRADHAKTQRELREFRERARQTQEDAHDRQAKAMVQQHGRAALQKFKLNAESPLVKEKFGAHALALAGGKPLTREVLYQAAEATSQDIHTLEREERAAAPARAAGKPLGVRTAAAPAALKVPANQNGKQRGFTPSQFAELRTK